MTAQLCPIHRVPMTIVPAEPRSRCPNCGGTLARLQFEDCPACGHKMVIEEPAPHWHCSLCVPHDASGNGQKS